MIDDLMMDDAVGNDDFDGTEDATSEMVSAGDTLEDISVSDTDPFGADIQAQITPEMPQLSLIEPGTGEPIHQSPAPSSVAEGHVGAGSDTDMLQWYQTSDGTQYAWGDDGSYYQVTPDGCVVQIAPDGSSAVTMPDGTFYAWDANGMPIELEADGNGDYSSYDDGGYDIDTTGTDTTGTDTTGADTTDTYDGDVALTEDGVYGSS